MAPIGDEVHGERTALIVSALERTSYAEQEESAVLQPFSTETTTVKTRVSTVAARLAGRTLTFFTCERERSTSYVVPGEDDLQVLANQGRRQTPWNWYTG